MTKYIRKLPAYISLLIFQMEYAKSLIKEPFYFTDYVEKHTSKNFNNHDEESSTERFPLLQVRCSFLN